MNAIEITKECTTKISGTAKTVALLNEQMQMLTKEATAMFWQKYGWDPESAGTLNHSSEP